MPSRIYGSGKKSQNVSETIYNILYRNIVNLNLVPGTLMSEKEISEKMQVSRTPVREAFIKLSKEALVSILPQKGTFVSKIDLSRVQEERFLRESLELSVLETFINTHTDESMDRLYRNMEKQKKSLESGELTKFIEYDDQFHAIFFEEAKKHMCYSVILSFSGHYRRIRYLSMSILGVSKDNIVQHEELLKTIKKGELDEARLILKKHLRKLIIEEDEIFERYPNYFEMKHRYIGDDELFKNNDDLFKDFQKDSLISIKKDS